MVARGRGVRCANTAEPMASEGSEKPEPVPVGVPLSALQQFLCALRAQDWESAKLLAYRSERATCLRPCQEFAACVVKV
eukprot:6206312-Pleurochrysis_carterae.AAC.1